MKEIKHLIWSSDVDVDDFEELFEEEGMPEEERYERACRENVEHLKDERCNLDIPLDGRIVVIADLGLWQGRTLEFKIINGENIKDIFYSLSNGECSWWSDGKDIRGEEHHHDGTNYYLYRELKENTNYDTLLDAIYNEEEISRQKLSYYTKSIAPKVHEVYGW